MIMVSNFLFSVRYFSIIICFLIKLSISGILFSTAVNAALVSKPVILYILPSISLTLAFNYAFLKSPILSGIFFSASLIVFSKSDFSVPYLVL